MFHRLLAREIAVPLVLSLVLVCLLLVAMQLLQLGDVLFGSGFQPLGILRIAGFLMPHFGIIAVPLAFLLACMLGLGRLGEDNELVAMSALGRSPLTLYAVPVAMSLVLGAGVGVLAFRGEPWGLRGVREQLNELIKRNVAGDVKPGTFFEDIPRFTLFVGRVGPDGRWERVLVQDADGEGPPRLMLAREGRIRGEGADASLRLDLTDGELHRTDGRTYTAATFTSGTLSMGVGGMQARQNKFDRPTLELLVEEMPEAARAARAAGKVDVARRIETTFHARLAALLSCLVFGLVAVPLAAGGRASRASGFVATLLAFAGYYVAQVTAGGWGESGRLSPVLAAWMPNLVGLSVAVALGLRLRRGPVAGARR
jgi:lipopolysaccharide export system permease protein